MASRFLRLRTDKIKKNGELPIHIVIKHNKRQKVVSTKESVKLKDWDKEKNKVKRSDKFSDSKNRGIRLCLDSLDKRIEELNFTKTEYSIEKIVEGLQSIQIKSDLANTNTAFSKMYLTDYMEAFIELNPDKNKVGTMKHYSSALRALKNFNRNILLKDFNVNDIEAFEKYLAKRVVDTKTGKTMGINTIAKRHADLKRVLSYALKNGHIALTPYSVFKIKSVKKPPVYLTTNELKAWQSLKGLSEKDELIRDIFLFSAKGTGLRIGDLLTLKVKHIRNSSGRYYMEKIVQKGNKELSIPITNLGVEIFKKYSDLKEKEAFVFGILEEWDNLDESKKLNVKKKKTAYINKRLKTLASKCGIKKKVSTHTARHSWAYILAQNEVSIEERRDLLGHSSVRVTEIYGGMSPERLVKAVNTINELDER